MGHNFRVLKWLHYIAKLEKIELFFPSFLKRLNTTSYHIILGLTLVTRSPEIPKLIQLRVLS